MTRTSKRRLAASLALATLAVCLGAAYDSLFSRPRREFARAVAKLDADDPGWRLDDLAAAHNAALPPDEANAAIQLLTALELAPKPSSLWAESGAHWESPPSNRLPDANAEAELRWAHSLVAPALPTTRRVRGLPGGGLKLAFARPNPFATPLAQRQELRAGARLLAIGSAVAALDGDAARAADDCVAILNAASGGVGDEPWLESQILRIVIGSMGAEQVERALAWCEPPEPALAALQARLLEELAAPRSAWGLRGERASTFEACGGLADGSVTFGAIFIAAPGSTSDALASRLLRGSARRAQALSLGYSGDALAAAALPDPERDAALTAVVAHFRALPKSRVPSPDHIVGWVFHAVDRCGAAETHMRARLGCAATAVACERFRRRAGRWPGSLAEIPTDILAAAPPDPYTGKPLIYKLTAEGAVVYSTGPNRTDDGGDGDLRTGLGPDRSPAGDIGFRLWNVQLRRAQPLPLPPEPPEPPE